MSKDMDVLWSVLEFLFKIGAGYWTKLFNFNNNYFFGGWPPLVKKQTIYFFFFLRLSYVVMYKSVKVNIVVKTEKVVK